MKPIGQPVCVCLLLKTLTRIMLGIMDKPTAFTRLNARGASEGGYKRSTKHQILQDGLIDREAHRSTWLCLYLIKTLPRIMLGIPRRCLRLPALTLAVRAKAGYKRSTQHQILQDGLNDREAYRSTCLRLSLIKDAHAYHAWYHGQTDRVHPP